MKNNAPVHIPRSQILHVPAEDGRAYRLSVALPRETDDGAGRLPAVYILDDYWFFAMFTQIVRTMRLFDELPPMYVIGVGYPTDRLADILALRMRDYTPTPDPDFVASFSDAYGLPLSEVTPGSGGAATFRETFREEIFPAVENTFRIDPECRLLTGWSFSALFCLYDLLHADRLFSDYLVVSPSLWWDDDGLLNREAEFAAGHRELPAKIHLSAGLDEGAEMVAAVKKLDALVRSRSYAGLSLVTELYPGETHLSVAAGAFSKGIRALFND